MIMKMNKRKNDNSLILLTINGSEKKYFTTTTRAGNYINIQASLIQYHMGRNNMITDEAGNTYKFEVVDGKDIPYGQINVF